MSEALAGLRVLELAQGISGPYCGKLMAGLGAEVIKVEPPEGDAARKAGPFPNDIADPETSGLFLYLNTGKKSITLDLQQQSDRRSLMGLAKDSDIVVENYAPGWLDSLGLGYADLANSNPQLVMVSITPFGQYGPYRNFQSTDHVVHALGGELYLAGDPDREPLKKGGNLTEYHGGLHGYVGALAALSVRQTTGRGQHVDVSLLEGTTSVIGGPFRQSVYTGTPSLRRGADANPWPTGVWLTKNGHIMAHSRPTVDWWPSFLAMTADVPEFANPEYATPEGRASHVEQLDVLFQSWLVERSKEHVYHLAQHHGLPFGFVAAAPDLLASPQLQARGFYVEVTHPVAGRLPYPGSPFALGKTPFQHTSAPLLGEHNETVVPPSERWPAVRETNMMPLEGVRVLDFSHIWAGPFCARILGDLGAEVIKIESISRYDPERGPVKIEPGLGSRNYPDGEPGLRPYNRAGRFNVYNRNKLGVTLDLRTDEGSTLIRSLIAISDVVIENFSVGVMERLGLDYEDCRRLRPDIVYASLSAFGRAGPEAQYVSYGLTQEAMSGLSSITGYPEGPPMDTGVLYGDPTAGLFGAAAVMTGLWHRRMTGEGQLIDLSQREAITSILPELIFEYAMNSRTLVSYGNRHPDFAPHGCYRCRGKDSWVTITVTSEEQFQALLGAMGDPKLAGDPRFRDMASRKRYEDELDQLVQGWTEQREPYDVMHMLQNAGIPAGAVLTTRQLLEDPHFQARGFFETVTQPDAGTHPDPGMPWKLSSTPVHIRRPTPGLGEHNELVLGTILGIPSEEIEELMQRNVIGNEPLSLRQRTQQQ